MADAPKNATLGAKEQVGQNLRDTVASENKNKEVRRAIAGIPSAASLGTTVPRTCGVIELSTAVAA